MEVSARLVSARLAETFVIARESQDEAELVQVEVRHGEFSGWGEAAPITRYGESAASALAFVEERGGEVLGEERDALALVGDRLAVLSGEQAAKAAREQQGGSLCLLVMIDHMAREATATAL